MWKKAVIALINKLMLAEGNDDEQGAVVKSNHSDILNKETLVIIFW